ncbi:hypothetical protein [Paracidovorax konjaci]|uniref:Uncharacterized protein n=1 Tax=Paracidovorax konjaci TaxID=32040 RepID=A0A1I1XCC2_9BURK|nr:hypothetical protein [Paracidovorax konjaci]SFE04997.1 hypothetical protein SAMN04489710_112130 [Paracidovorax konjaci]
MKKQDTNTMKKMLSSSLVALAIFAAAPMPSAHARVIGTVNVGFTLKTNHEPTPQEIWNAT